jgi:hypothetical protein
LLSWDNEHREENHRKSKKKGEGMSGWVELICWYRAKKVGMRIEEEGRIGSVIG